MTPTEQLATWAFVALLTLSSCGQPDSTTDDVAIRPTDPTAWVDGLEVSSQWSVQVLSDERFGPVVIDTAATTERRHAVVAKWHDGGELIVATDDDRPALMFAWAWQAPDRLFVAGITCPSPQLDNTDVLTSDPNEGCGGHEPSYAIRILDMAERSWSEVTPDLPLLMGQVVNVISPGETTMIVGAGSEADPDVQALYRIDLTTGATTPIPEDSDFERVSGCTTADGVLVYLAAPIGLEGQGRGGRLARLNGNTTEELGTVDGLKVKFACTTDGMLLWDPGTETLNRALIDTGQIHWDDIPIPEPIAGEAFGRFVPQRNLGYAPAIWESHGTTFQLWRLDDLTWVRTGPTFKGLDPPEVAAVAGDTLVLMSGSSPSTLSLADGTPSEGG